ncbi:hypothetical protein ASG22_17895 [Chryseobacterium sp. Leaf405]|uniref:hypothetical protein n=1 Tax=Chryseobacterium sp. Leaf405 TaxID=1736367 RepID=UPI0006F8F933|nr:hypothetical protein [Chryseobacterium sp. Leaf405]KQT33095.1 hypothetical protein ASG22_17895 [Chryseobacterium sp. Leaf405]
MKKIFVLSFISVGYFLNAQNLSNSPYATYGIGDVKYDNTIETASMGGISTAFISDFTSNFNFANPANNANFELTSIKLEATNENNYFKTDYNNTKATKHSTYLSNISLAFPLSQKLKMGLSYQPYSSKSYDILSPITTTTEGTVTTIGANRFKGSGTLNTAQIALGYKVNDKFAVGVRANYYFGNLYDLNELAYADAELINGYETKNNIKNFNFTLGASYQNLNTSTDRKFTLGATTTFGNTSKMSADYRNTTYFYDATGTVKNNETVIEEKNTSTKNLLPLQASIGAGYGEENKWFVSLQGDYKKGESINNFGTTIDLQDTYRISAGGWYLPNYNNFRSYFSRIVYRYGAFYERGNLSINDAGKLDPNGTSINKVGISAGVLLPFKTSSITRMSGLELGIELGKRGTTKNNLINQNYVNVRVGFNFADKWFRKTLYN